MLYFVLRTLFEAVIFAVVICAAAIFGIFYFGAIAIKEAWVAFRESR